MTNNPANGSDDKAREALLEKRKPARDFLRGRKHCGHEGCFESMQDTLLEFSALQHEDASIRKDEGVVGTTAHQGTANGFTTSSPATKPDTQHSGELVGWQPIETAPKDGRTALIHYVNSNGKYRIIKAQFVPKFTQESDDEWSEYNEENDCYYTPEGWYECMDNWDEYSSCHICGSVVKSFTHWMPLPQPPKENA